jgi:hypothetical protein
LINPPTRRTFAHLPFRHGHCSPPEQCVDRAMSCRKCSKCRDTRLRLFVGSISISHDGPATPWPLSALGPAIALIWLLLCGPSLAEPVQFNGRIFDLAVPSGMCALSEQRHKAQFDFARQVSPERRLLALIVPCDRLSLYEPGSSASADTSLLFDTAEWGVLLNGEREIRVSGNGPALIGSIKAGLQQGLEALNSARAKGQRFPATGPELRNLTIVGERSDRIFTTSINRFQRPFDRGPVDRYTASGFVLVAPYIFKFSIFSYVKNENDLLVRTLPHQ